MAGETEQVDHAEEARRAATFADGMDSGEPAERELLRAQVHASLAIAEELRGIREVAEGVNERLDALSDYDHTAATSGKKKLKVSRA